MSAVITDARSRDAAVHVQLETLIALRLRARALASAPGSLLVARISPLRRATCDRPEHQAVRRDGRNVLLALAPHSLAEVAGLSEVRVGNDPAMW